MRALVSYAAALVGSVAVGLVGLGFWVFGQGRYLEDFCFTRAPEPEGPLEGHTVSGPSYDSPVHLRCEWDAYPDVVVLDPMPLLGALVVAAVAVVVTVVLFWNAHRTARGHGSR